MAFTGAQLSVSAADARGRLLAELASGPAKKAYGIAYDLLGNRAEAEEAVQEALARACESIGELREPGAARGWYLRIVTTMCLRTLRRRRLKRRLFGWMSGSPDKPDSQGELDHDAVAARVHAEPGPAPVTALANHQELGALMSRLDKLPPQQRTALVLRYGHDLPVPEVAAMLGVELATCKTHLVRGLARLRDLMEEHR